jgi:hypothetical protein
MAPVVGQEQQFNALDQNGTTMHVKRQTHVKKMMSLRLNSRGHPHTVFPRSGRKGNWIARLDNNRRWTQQGREPPVRSRTLKSSAFHGALFRQLSL